MLIDELLKKIDSYDEEERREAVESLLGMPFEQRMRQLLKKAMGDESWRVRKSAVNAALSFNEAAAESAIVPLMIDALHSEDNVGLRNSAVECLTRFGMKAVPYLIQNLDDKDHDVRKFIVDTLGDIWTSKGHEALDQGIVDTLIKATDDPDENVRLSAIEGMGKIGNDKAVAALLDILEKGDMSLKFASLEALGNIGSPIPMKGVYNAVSDRFLKRAAYDLIGKVGGAEAVPYLIDGLQESSTSTREAAIAALYRLAASLQISNLKSQILNLKSSAIKKIAASLQSSDLTVKKGAVFILGLTGKEEAAEPLIKALYFDEIADGAKEVLIGLGSRALDIILNMYQKQEEKVRGLLCFILGEIGSKVVLKGPDREEVENILINALKDDYGHVRSSAARALAKINPEKAVTETVSLLHDEFDDVRNAAVDALCLLAKDLDKVVLSKILPLLSGDNPSYIREKAVIVLGRIGHGAQIAPGSEEIEKIRLSIKDDSPIVRKAAVHAIEERVKAWEDQHAYRRRPEAYASTLHIFVQDIILALADEDREVRLAAISALGNIKLEEVVEPLLMALNDEDVWVKAAALEELGRMGSLCQSSRCRINLLNAIREMADNENGMIVCAALDAMAKIAAEEPQTIKEIKSCAVKCFSHSDAEVVKAAVQVMEKIDRQGAVNSILPLLEHADWGVRAQVVDALSGRKDDFIRNRLEAHLKTETDELVKQRITEALKDRK